MNLREMFGLRVPIISVVIGEGGSGGALAIGACYLGCLSCRVCRVGGAQGFWPAGASVDSARAAPAARWHRCDKGL